MAPQFPIPPEAFATPSPIPPSAVLMPSATIAAPVPSMAAQSAVSTMAGSMAIDLTKINPYIYSPSFTMALVGAMAFLISTTIHTAQLVKTRSWYLIVMQNAPMIAAASLIARAHSVRTLAQTGATGPFVIFTVLDMISGSVTNMGIIFTYTRLMFWVTPEDKRNMQTLRSPPMWTSFTWAFLLFIGDASKTAAQTALDRMSPPAILIQQIAFTYLLFVLGGFTFLTYRFMRMSKRWVIHGECEAKDWRRLGWTIVASAAIMTFRQIFVIVQLDARTDLMSFYAQHEWVYWATGPIPLFVVLTLFNLAHPGFFLPRAYTGFVIKLNEIAAAKRDAQWPLSISPPFPMKGSDVLQNDGLYTRVVEVRVGKDF